MCWGATWGQRKMVNQLDFITQYITKVQQLIIVQAAIIFPYERQPSENDRKEEVCLIRNQVLGSWPTFQQSPENQVWDFGVDWTDGRRMSKSLHNHDKRHERFKSSQHYIKLDKSQVNEMLALILNKLEASDNVLSEMKLEFSQLSRTMLSHATSI